MSSSLTHQWTACMCMHTLLFYQTQHVIFIDMLYQTSLMRQWRRHALTDRREDDMFYQTFSIASMKMTCFINVSSSLMHHGADRCLHLLLSDILILSHQWRWHVLTDRRRCKHLSAPYKWCYDADRRLHLLLSEDASIYQHHTKRCIFFCLIQLSRHFW